MSDEPKFFWARVVRLSDDGLECGPLSLTFRTINEMRFTDEQAALDWGRSALATYLELGERNFAIQITSDYGKQRPK